MLKKYIISNKKLLETDAEKAQVYVYTNPTAAEQRFLVDGYQIDEHTLSSALDPDELPRLEFEPEHSGDDLQTPQKLFRQRPVGV